MKSKICGVTDKLTLKYITTHLYPPKFVGFICNYKKSKRFVKFNKLKNLLKVDKKNSKYVAVLVKPTNKELEKIKKLPFDYYQIYDLKRNQIESIKKKYKIKIIVAITIRNVNDVLKYKNYKNVADIFLFDGKGYEKSISFNHKLIKSLKSKIKIMLAGNVQINDNLRNYIISFILVQYF